MSLNCTGPLIRRFFSNKYVLWGIPGGPVVEYPTSNAGDTGSTPAWGAKIPYAVGQLSLCATTKTWYNQINFKKKVF